MNNKFILDLRSRVKQLEISQPNTGRFNPENNIDYREWKVQQGIRARTKMKKNTDLVHLMLKADKLGGVEQTAESGRKQFL